MSAASALLFAEGAGAADRGFELVGPADDHGYAVQGIASQPGGDGFYWRSSGGSQTSDPAPDDGAKTDVFLSRRSSSGWTTSWITPDPAGTTPTTVEPSGLPGMEADGYVFNTLAGPGQFFPYSGLFLGTESGSALISAPAGSAAEAGLDTQQWISSTDLSATVFSTTAALTPDDTNGAADLYVRRGDSLALVSHRSSGTTDGTDVAPYLSGAYSRGIGALVNSNESVSGFPASQGASPISQDGHSIVFGTAASLDPSDTDGTNDLYLWRDGVVSLISDDERTAAGCPDPSDANDCQVDAEFVGMSADASSIYFRTAEGLVDGDTDGGSDIYRYQPGAPAGHRLTLATGDGGLDANPVAVTRDGQLFFESEDRLGVDPPAGTTPVIYRFDGTSIRTVSAIDRSDVFSDSGDLVGPAAAIPVARTVRATADGSALVFQTAAALDPADDDGAPDLYRWRADGGLTLLSGTGTAPVTIGVNTDGPTAGGFFTNQFGQGRGISDDASQVFFTSTDALTPDAGRNGRPKLYEYRDGSGIGLVSPSGAEAGAVTYVDNSASGADAFFMTGDALVGADTDGDAIDVYDARLGGGFPEPPAPPPPCAGDACQGPTPLVPPTPPLGSTSSGSTGNVTPTKPVVTKLEVAKPKPVRRGTSVRLSVKVVGKGRLTASGSGLRRTTRSAAKAGTYALTLRLSALAVRTLRHKHRLVVHVTVRFASTSGPPQSSQVPVTFKGAAHVTAKGR